MAAPAAPAPPVRKNRRPGRRRGLVWLLAGAGLAGLLLLAAYVMPPLSRPGAPVASPGPGATINYANASFSEDRAIADRLALNLSDGPWNLVGAFALTSASPARVPLAASGASGCPLIPDPYASMATVEIPPRDFVDGSGLDALWTFDYLGPGNTGLRLAVRDGIPSVLGHLNFNGTGCGAPGPAPTLVPANPIDSTTAGLDALSLGGQTFLDDYPMASVAFSLEARPEPNSSGVPVDQWNVTFDGCGTAPNSGDYSAFAESWTVWLDGDSGDMEAYSSNVTACPQGTSGPIPYPISEALQFNAPVQSTWGDTQYANVSVSAICCGLELANLSADLHPTGSAPPPASAALEIDNANGTLVCVATLEGEGQFLFSCPEAIQVGDLFSVALPARGSGALALTFEGLWDFSGEVVVPISAATET